VAVVTVQLGCAALVDWRQASMRVHDGLDAYLAENGFNPRGLRRPAGDRQHLVCAEGYVAYLVNARATAPSRRGNATDR